MLLYIKITFQLQSIAIAYLKYLIIFFLSNFVFRVLQHFLFRRLIRDLVDGS